VQRELEVLDADHFRQTLQDVGAHVVLVAAGVVDEVAGRVEDLGGPMLQLRFRDKCFHRFFCE
jgi:hypothetical protein